MNRVLARWNQLASDQAAQEIMACCGSNSWAKGLASKRPIESELSLVTTSDELWHGLTPDDWMEAFSKHPRIGESRIPPTAGLQSFAWSTQEQAKVAGAEQSVHDALAQGNRAYEHRFARVFIICATGKSASEILQILNRRLTNDDAAELHEAAEQQRQITNLRLQKWLSS